MLALTQHSAFAKAWPYRQAPLESATPEQIRDEPVVILAPETPNIPAVWRILEARKSNQILTPLIFGTYKGREYWLPELEPYVAAWVVHCRSDIRSTRHRVVLFGLDGRREGTPDGGYVFCGGRKMRDFEMAYEAIPPGTKATFISDFLPSLQPRPGITWIPRRIPLRDYLATMASASLVFCPLRPHFLPHGHTDVVRALLAEKPVVATRGASCGEYIQDGQNGYLVDYSPAGFRSGLERALRNLPALQDYCRAEGWKPHTAEAYNAQIVELANAQSRQASLRASHR